VPSPPREIWRKGVGRGVSVPVMVAGPVVMATTTSRSVVTLAAESGMQYWDRRFRSAIAGTALRRDDRLYLATGGGENKVWAIDLARGRKIWERRVGASRAAPAAADRTVYAALENGELMALAATDGSTLWRIRLSAGSVVAPIVSGESLLLATTADTLYRIERSSGRISARMAIPAAVSAPPLLQGETLILPLQNGMLLAVSTPALSESWRADVGGSVLAPPTPTADGSVLALTRNAEVWRIDRVGQARRIAALEGAASGSLAQAAGRIIVGRLDGWLFVLDLDGNVVWKKDMMDSIVAPVTVVDDAIYVPLLHGDVVKLQ
jgi:outer membrane protein assembly factor BamB